MQFGAFRESLEKQELGAPFKKGEATIFVKRWGTRESEKYLADLRRELFSPFSKDQNYFPELLAHWLAGYGVTGWEGIYDDSGSELLPFSPTIARQSFLDEGVRLSLNFEIFEFCQNYENYLEDIAREDEEEIKK